MRFSNTVLYLRKALILLCLGLTLSGLAHAHRSYESFLTLKSLPDRTEFIWKIETNNFETLFELDDSNNGIISWKELRNHQELLLGYASPHLSFNINDRSLIKNISAVDIARLDDQTYLIVSGALSVEPEHEGAFLEIDYSLFFDQDSQQRLLFRFHSNTSEYLYVISPERRRLTINLKNGKVEALVTWKLYLEEGVRHLLEGLDHIAFLLLQVMAIVGFYATRSAWYMYSSLAKVVTAFTLGHSITLCLAAFELVYLPARWVELAIAMTVLWSAGANLARSLWGDIDAARTTSSLFGVVFCFGLIHGFGFANVLFALDMPQSQFVVALLGFNLGLEFAQLGIVLLIVPLLVPLRRYKGLFMSLIRAISLAAGGLAVYWISQRI